MKVIVSIVFLLNICFANEYFTTQILKSNPSIDFQNIKEKDGFKPIVLPISKKTISEHFWIKLNIDKTKLSKENKLLKISSMFGINDIRLDPSLEHYLIDKSTFEIDEHISDTIYLKVINIQNNINVNIEVFDKKEYVENKVLKSKFYGVAQGIALTAFLYYMLFYIFNRKKSFLYYSLTQLFTSGILLLSQQSNYLPYDFISTGFVVFSILFTQEFLQTKKHLPTIHKIFNFMIIIFTLDTFLPLSESFPMSFLMLLYPISGAITYYKTRQKEVLVYILAWGIIVFAFVLITIQIYLVDFIHYNINLVDILHVIMPLESIILAFALSYSMKLIEEEKVEKEKLLVHQNKLASLGEMINNIAHQWRQPLTHLNYIFMNLNKAYELGKLDDKYMDKKSNEAKEQLKYMSKTIDIFKDFYTPKTQTSEISIKQEIDNTLQIISATLKKEKIEISLVGEDFFSYGFKGELSQVILNLITNAKDAFFNKHIENPSIAISIKNKTIQVKDNAGGVDDDIVENMFNPYFTTKEEGNGIGLYMSKQIIENHFNGRLRYKKIDNKSIFTIDLNTKNN